MYLNRVHLGSAFKGQGQIFLVGGIIIFSKKNILKLYSEMPLPFPYENDKI
jgi:hypothetical protein